MTLISLHPVINEATLMSGETNTPLRAGQFWTDIGVTSYRNHYFAHLRPRLQTSGYFVDFDL